MFNIVTSAFACYRNNPSKKAQAAVDVCDEGGSDVTTRDFPCGSSGVIFVAFAAGIAVVKYFGINNGRSRPERSLLECERMK